MKIYSFPFFVHEYFQLFKHSSTHYSSVMGGQASKKVHKTAIALNQGKVIEPLLLIMLSRLVLLKRAHVANLANCNPFKGTHTP